MSATANKALFFCDRHPRMPTENVRAVEKCE